MRKGKILAFGAALVCAAGCCGMLAACGDDAPAQPNKVHIAAVAADCTTGGNIEYWKLGNKLYSDENCKNEIEEFEIYIAALDHDFENGTYDKDYSGHWKKCAREFCNAVSEKEAHEENAEVCVCGWELTVSAVEYNITVSDEIENGSISVSASTAEAGAEITVTVIPDNGYVLKSLEYNGNDITAEMKFIMPEEHVTVTAEFEAEAQPPEPQTGHIGRNEPTCTEYGNIEYWKIGDNYYSDAECDEIHRIELSDTLIAPLDHDFDNGTYGGDEIQHWKICAREGCDAIGEKTNHNGDDGIVTKQPTLASEGVRSFECSECHRNYTASIAALDKENMREEFYTDLDNKNNWSYGWVEYHFPAEGSGETENFDFYAADTYTEAGAWTNSDKDYEIKADWINGNSLYMGIAYTADGDVDITFSAKFTGGNDLTRFALRWGVKDENGNIVRAPEYIGGHEFDCSPKSPDDAQAPLVIELKAGYTIYFIFNHEFVEGDVANGTIDITLTKVNKQMPESSTEQANAEEVAIKQELA